MYPFFLVKSTMLIDIESSSCLHISPSFFYITPSTLQYWWTPSLLTFFRSITSTRSQCWQTSSRHCDLYFWIMLINSADDLFIHFHAESCEQSFRFQVKVLPINMSCWKNNLFRLKFTKNVHLQWWICKKQKKGTFEDY